MRDAKDQAEVVAAHFKGTNASRTARPRFRSGHYAVKLQIAGLVAAHVRRHASRVKGPARCPVGIVAVQKVAGTDQPDRICTDEISGRSAQKTPSLSRGVYFRRIQDCAQQARKETSCAVLPV